MLAGILMPLFGGLALFLFGMHVMSEGIEKAAGAKMRSILEFFTTNRFTGMIVGLFFTAVIQSSSAIATVNRPSSSDSANSMDNVFFMMGTLL